MIEVNPRVKDALRSGNYRKNYRILVLNDDGTTASTITNTELVTESVKIDERLCSGDDLKFGLCEGASIEFQYFDHDTTNIGNIRGKRIQVFVDVQYEGADGVIAWEPIPMGYFDIDQCSTQFSTGIMKAVGYNKLRSEYLDQKANIKIEEEYEGMAQVTVGDVLDYLLSGFAIDEKRKEYVDPSFTIPGLNTSTNFTVSNYGDIGPLSMLPNGWTWSTPIYDEQGHLIDVVNNTIRVEPSLDVGLRLTTWYCGDPSPYKVRVRFDEDLDAIEDITHDFIADHIASWTANKTTDQIIESLYSGISTSMPGLPSVPFFGFVVIRDVSGVTVTEFYSKWAKYYGYGVGSCNDINKISFDNARQITFITPILISKLYDTQTSMSGHSEPTSNQLYVRADAGGTGDPLISPVVNGQKYKYVTPIEGGYEMHEGEYIYPDDIKGITFHPNNFRVYKLLETDAAEEIELSPFDLPDVTLRELQTAVYETVAEFGQLDRVTDLFSGVQLSRERLFPADDLYPDDALYPQSVAESSFRSQYSKLWTDSVGVQTFRNLYITYKTMVDDGQGNLREQEVIMSRVVNADGTTDYNCSDNWLFKNLIWTEQQIAAYADAMVLKMRGIKWFPFEMWAAGLPYIEVGDELEINTKDGTYTSYVLQRQLTGIQNLQDRYINGTLDIF